MKRIYTVRTTQLEAFRLWFYGQTEDNESWNTEQKVIDTVQGRYEANIKADYGTAGHAVIEDPIGTRRHDGSYVYKDPKPILLKDGTYLRKDFVFSSKQAKPLLEYHAEHPFMIRETPVAKVYPLKNCDLVTTGTVDGLEGNIMRDNKFKFSNFSLEEYIESIQHRIYMDCLGMEIFYYDFFRVKGFETFEDVSASVISPVESMRLTAYPQMQADIHEIMEEFMSWIAHHRLEPFLTMTELKAAKIIAGDASLKKILNL